jgi:hypothetical protein
MPRIGRWQEQLAQFLSSKAGKPSRERLTLIRIFEELRGLGYLGRGLGGSSRAIESERAK